MKKIKVGFLIDGLKVNSYVYDLIQHVDKSNFFLAPVLIHGTAQYGKSFGVNKVLTLNTFKYSEVRVANIDSNYKSKIHYTHHYSANSEFAAVDFARITSKS